MKKFILALIALFTITVSASAMSYDQARQQALTYSGAYPFRNSEA